MTHRLVWDRGQTVLVQEAPTLPGLRKRVEKRYSEDQERDDHGRWAGSPDEAKWTDWAYEAENIKSLEATGKIDGKPLDSIGHAMGPKEVAALAATGQWIQQMASTQRVPFDTVYRGEGYATEQEIHDKYTVGATATNPTLTSSATEKEIATQYALGPGGAEEPAEFQVMVTIHDSVGLVGVQTAPLGPSAEIVLPRGGTYRVVGKEADGVNHYAVKLVAIKLPSQQNLPVFGTKPS